MELRRSVVREQEFEEQLERLIPNAEEADDFTLGAELVLALNPEIGSPVNEWVWVLPMAPVRSEEVYLYYAFDEETVYFLWILDTRSGA
jgi:hypothetical protein